MDNNPLWNRKNLLQPPNSSYKPSTQDLDLNKFRFALQDGIKHFKDEFLATEATLLSRIIYRMKMKFRNAKDFKQIETLSRSLNIYFNTNLSRHLKGILDMTPRKYGLETYLPARNMLSFILVRLQGIVKLLEKIYDTAQLIAIQLTHRLSIGHFWKVFLILFGLVSRISVLVKFNTKFFCELYGKLYPHLNKLENIGKNWLPKDYDFPVDLQSWLGVNWVYEDIYVDLTFEETNGIMSFFNLVDDEDDDVLFCDEYIVVDDEDKRDSNGLSLVQEVLARNRMRGFSIDENDIGEEIIEINDTIVTGNNAKQPKEDTIMGLRDDNEDSGQEIHIGNPEVIILDTPLSNQVKKGKRMQEIMNKNRHLNNDQESANKKRRISEEDLISFRNNSELEIDSGQVIDVENPEIIILDTPLPNSNKKSKRKSEKINKLAKKRKSLIENEGSPNKQSKKGKKKMKKGNKNSSIILSGVESETSNLNLSRSKKNSKYECYLSKIGKATPATTVTSNKQPKSKRRKNLKNKNKKNLLKLCTKINF